MTINPSIADNDWVAFMAFAKPPHGQYLDLTLSLLHSYAKRGYNIVLADSPGKINMELVKAVMENGYSYSIMSLEGENPRVIDRMMGRDFDKTKKQEDFFPLLERLVEFTDYVHVIWDGEAQLGFRTAKMARNSGAGVTIYNFNKEDRKTGEPPRVTIYKKNRLAQNTLF